MSNLTKLIEKLERTRKRQDEALEDTQKQIAELQVIDEQQTKLKLTATKK